MEPGCVYAVDEFRRCKVNSICARYDVARCRIFFSAFWKTKRINGAAFC